MISEEAETARIEFFSEDTGKLIYSKALTGLRKSEDAAVGTQSANAASEKAGADRGLSEADMLQEVDRRFKERRRNDEFQSLSKEVIELRSKNDELVIKIKELEVSLKSKSGMEFYSSVIGNAFPGLAKVLKGTPLKGAADFLSGTTDEKGNTTPTSEQANEGASSLASMVTEFCNTLNEQEAGAIHLLFRAFEADHGKIHKALQCVATGT